MRSTRSRQNAKGVDNDNGHRKDCEHTAIEIRQFFSFSFVCLFFIIVAHRLNGWTLLVFMLFSIVSIDSSNNNFPKLKLSGVYIECIIPEPEPEYTSSHVVSFWVMTLLLRTASIAANTLTHDNRKNFTSPASFCASCACRLFLRFWHSSDGHPTRGGEIAKMPNENEIARTWIVALCIIWSNKPARHTYHGRLCFGFMRDIYTLAHTHTRSSIAMIDRIYKRNGNDGRNDQIIFTK